MGWAIEEYSFTNLPVGMSINGSRLSINSQTNQTGSFTWYSNATSYSNTGSIDYEAMNIDRKYGSAQLGLTQFPTEKRSLQYLWCLLILGTSMFAE